MKKYFLFIILLFVLIPGCFIKAQEDSTIIQDQVSIYKAKVIDILESSQQTVPGTTVAGVLQKLQVEIIEGPQQGKVVTFSNDFIELKKGEVFYLRDTIQGETGKEVYAVFEQDRMPAIYFLLGLFVICVFIFGGVQGIRGLLSLFGSLILILYVLLPGILHGYSPMIVTIGVSSLIIVIGSYITHGFNRTTTAAVLGMIGTVIFTGFLAYISVKLTKLTGYATEESVYLNLSLDKSIDMVGLLFGGIMIGLLGVLYDVAIGQAISVEELHHVGPHVPKKIIYKRAIRIGREHIGALVNTLAIAYVGASLPLLLLFYSSASSDFISPTVVVNREVFAAEIVRTLIGSMGLILAVPITTFIAVWFLIKGKKVSDPHLIKEEEESLNHIGHHH